MGRLFGTDGVRGVAGRDLTARLGLKWGRNLPGMLTKLLAAASNPWAGGGEVKLFDLKTRKEVRSIRGHAKKSNFPRKILPGCGLVLE